MSEEKETLFSYSIKGTIILVSFSFGSIAASLVLNYLLGMEMSPETFNVLGVSLVLLIPGGFYLGKAISHKFVINPIYEREEDSQEETLKIAEKTLLDLTDTLKEQQTKLTAAVGVLEFTAQKNRILLWVWFSGFAAAVVAAIILSLLSNLFF